MGSVICTAAFVAEKYGWTKFVTMQNRYNLIYRREEREMNRFCNDTGVGLIPVRYGFASRQVVAFARTTNLEIVGAP